jgi:peptidoglycan/xylan/chitin deacetylase (PgdA/CDA1 family)
VCFDHRSAKTPQAVATRVLSLANPGEILLLHDARGDRRRAVAALPIVLRKLEARGYKVVTVSRLLADAAAGK